MIENQTLSGANPPFSPFSPQNLYIAHCGEFRGKAANFSPQISYIIHCGDFKAKTAYFSPQNLYIAHCGEFRGKNSDIPTADPIHSEFWAKSGSKITVNPVYSVSQ